MRSYLRVMSVRAALFVAACVVCMALPLGAHPHIFVDAGLRLILNAEGRLAAVDVTWRYDALYSMLLTEDYGLDPDHDLRLTPDEIAITLGFDLNWSGGFAGGLVITQGGAPLDIGPPVPVSLRLLETGQIETVHRRPVLGAPPMATLEAQIFDPDFYVAFEMILDLDLTDAPGCSADLIRADLDAAYGVLEAALDAIGGAVAAEDNFPPVGAYFADRVVITCPG